MSNCEEITQVTHDKIAQVTRDKIATMSVLLRSLMIKEQMSKSIFFFANHSITLLLTKTSNLQKKLNKIIFVGTFFVSLKILSDSLIVHRSLRNFYFILNINPNKRGMPAATK